MEVGKWSSPKMICPELPGRKQEQKSPGKTVAEPVPAMPRTGFEESTWKGATKLQGRVDLTWTYRGLSVDLRIIFWGNFSSGKGGPPVKRSYP